MSEDTVKNFLYTKGYVRKRLSDSGLECHNLNIRYSQQDKRYWSLLINTHGGNENLIVTCMKSGISEKRGVFQVYGSTFSSFRIDTKSAEILIQSLTDLCHPEEIHHEKAD